MEMSRGDHEGMATSEGFRMISSVWAMTSRRSEHSRVGCALDTRMSACFQRGE